MNTGIKAYFDNGLTACRHTVVESVDWRDAVAEIKRQDAIAPPFTRQYTKYEVTQWEPGVLGSNTFWISPEEA